MKVVSYSKIRKEARSLYESYVLKGEDGPSYQVCLEHIFEMYLCDGFAVVHQMEVVR